MLENISGENIFLIVAGIIDAILLITIILYLTKRDKSTIISEEPVLTKTSINDTLEAMKKDVSSTPKTLVSSFEEEQEKKAIISYQELLKVHEASDIEEEETTKVKIEEPVKIKVQEVIEEPVVEEKIFKKAEPKKVSYQEAEFISPVFGRVDSRGEAIKSPLNKEVKVINKDQRYDDFLESLKEFRNNL